MSEHADEPWILADRYKVAHTMAKGGAAREEIMRVTRLTQLTVTCIVNRHQPGAHSGLAKNNLE